MQRSEFSIEDIGRGRTMMIGDLDYIEEQGGHVFECNKVRSNPTPPAMDQGHTPASITQPKGWETDFFDDVRSRPPASAHRGRITSIPTQLTTARCKYFPATFPVIQTPGGRRLRSSEASTICQTAMRMAFQTSP